VKFVRKVSCRMIIVEVIDSAAGDTKVSALHVMKFCILDIEHPRWCIRSQTYVYLTLQSHTTSCFVHVVIKRISSLQEPEKNNMYKIACRVRLKS
jgi:hypothetical protein